MNNERLRLSGTERTKYFAPVAFCAYIALICIALIITAVFLSEVRNTVAVAAAGVFGFILSAGLGAGILLVQLRELRFWRLPTRRNAEVNYEIVARLAHALGWRVTRAEVGQQLDARTADSMLHQGEIVVVHFRAQHVLVASICDPAVGYSLVGRRRCQDHREQVRHALLS